MGSRRTFGWRASLVATVAMIVMASPAGWNAAQAQMKMKPGAEEGALAGTKREALFVPARGAVGPDGWAMFEHGKVNLKVGAPTPAVPLQGAERDQWTKDIATFKFDELKDRQVLYVYYLSPTTAEAANALLKAVKDAASPSAKAGAPWAAIGVQYDTAGLDARTFKMAGVSPDLYRMAAVPLEWNMASYEFVKSEHDPATFAALVKATATALPKGAYDNFGAVEKWSALAKAFNVKLAKDAKKLQALKARSKGPFLWLDLKPVASFIALDRKLEIEGVDPERILTSKMAWWATGK